MIRNLIFEAFDLASAMRSGKDFSGLLALTAIKSGAAPSRLTVRHIQLMQEQSSVRRSQVIKSHMLGLTGCADWVIQPAQ